MKLSWLAVAGSLVVAACAASGSAAPGPPDAVPSTQPSQSPQATHRVTLRLSGKVTTWPTRVTMRIGDARVELGPLRTRGLNPIVPCSFLDTRTGGVAVLDP